MNLKRGDVALARFPHAAGGRGKKRPVVVVQADAYNKKLRHVIVAEVTTNRAAVLSSDATMDARFSGAHSIIMQGIRSTMTLPLLHAGDWTTYGHDPQRTGWAAEETTLTAANVGQLGLQWKARVDNQFFSLSALTSPVVATNVSTTKGNRTVAYVAGISGTVFALDGQTGERIPRDANHVIAAIITIMGIGFWLFRRTYQHG